MKKQTAIFFSFFILMSGWSQDKIMVAWKCNDWLPQRRVGKIIEQDFPFEELKAMIDK